ncbi:unnamed protein product [Strongylus vulgaris]|uniref:Uncharacterized protein n=1 Tax=Strongylus vulgaris TaxID=40348 RepID=A0A3P7JJG0_STRVU|nr:unnamed protein product [Strongylus vulgaris]
MINDSQVLEAAKRCYSGSKDNYQSRYCDTGVNTKYVCQKFYLRIFFTKVSFIKHPKTPGSIETHGYTQGSLALNEM